MDVLKREHSRIEDELRQGNEVLARTALLVSDTMELVELAYRLVDEAAGYGHRDAAQRKRWNKAFFRRITVVDRQIVDVEYEGPFASLLSGDGSISDCLVPWTGSDTAQRLLTCCDSCRRRFVKRGALRSAHVRLVSVEAFAVIVSRSCASEKQFQPHRGTSSRRTLLHEVARQPTVDHRFGSPGGQLAMAYRLPPSTPTYAPFFPLRSDVAAGSQYTCRTSSQAV